MRPKPPSRHAGLAVLLERALFCTLHRVHGDEKLLVRPWPNSWRSTPQPLQRPETYMAADMALLSKRAVRASGGVGLRAALLDLGSFLLTLEEEPRARLRLRPDAAAMGDAVGAPRWSTLHRRCDRDDPASRGGAARAGGEIEEAWWGWAGK